MTTEPDRVESAARIPDHVARGVARLTHRWTRPIVDTVDGVTATRASRTVRILTPWLQQVQEIEDAIWSVLALTLDTATGDALDQYGAILRAARAGLSDTVYRRLLRGVALAIRSSGTGDELLAVIEAMLPGDVLALTEHFPASLVIEPANAPDVPTSAMHAAMKRAVAGGVRLLTIDVPTGDTFAFSATRYTTTDAARGFSDVAGEAGGQLVGAIE